jgi:hypothetical protein
MAKYEIVSVGADGQYTVKERLDAAALTARIAALQTEITALQTRNGEIDSQIPPLEAELQAVQAQIEIAFTSTPPDIETGQKLTKYSLTIALTIGNLRRQKSENSLKIAQNNKKIVQIQAVIDQQTVVQNAVCIDGDDTLTVGQIVGSIELHRFPRDKSTGKVLIRPGTSAGYTGTRDGITRHAIGMGASELFVNQALLPPAQAFLPRFVAAIVDSVDQPADTLSASPYIEPNNHPATWWEGATPVRPPAESYTDIPVVYKDCNAAAFKVGDKVVIDYQLPVPTVVGFVDNPAPCATGFLAVATPLDFVAACGIECDAAFAVDWGDGSYINYPAGRIDVVPSGDITVKNQSGAVVTWCRFHTDTFTAIDIQQSSTLTSLRQTFDTSTFASPLQHVDIQTTKNITDFYRAFYACVNLVSVPVVMDTSAGLNFDFMFYRCASLSAVPAIDVGLSTSLLATFRGCSSITNFPSIDVSMITNFRETFSYLTSLLSFPVLDMSSAIDVRYIFSRSADAVKVIVDYPVATNFEGAWSGSYIVDFPVINAPNGLVFKDAWSGMQSISTFQSQNLPSATTLSGAFSVITSSFTIGHISAPNVDTLYLFCYNATGLQSISGLTVTSCTNIVQAWEGCSGMSAFPSVSFPSVIYWGRAWANCGVVHFPATDIPGTGAGGGSVHRGSTALLTHGGGDYVNESQFNNMFDGCTNLQTVGALGTSFGSHFNLMFNGCGALTSIGAIDTTRKGGGLDMFNGCVSLVSPGTLDQNRIRSSRGYDFN